MTLTTFYRVDLRAITNVDISWEVDEDKDIMYLVVTITDKSFVYSLCQTTRVPASTEEPSGKCVARVAFENDMTTDNVIPLYFQAKINDKIREFWTKNNTSCHPYDYDSDYDVATYEDLQ